MATDIKIKKRITEEWLKAFPSLRPYTHNKLYKIIGPFAAGLELIKLPRIDQYRPHFVIYPLYKKDVKSALEFPCLMFEFYTVKKLQINLPYDDPKELYKNAQQLILQSLKIQLADDVELNELQSFIDEQLSTDFLYQVNPGKRASLFEVKFNAALYTGSNNQMENIIHQAEKESKSWDMKAFETWMGKFDLWIKGLENKMGQRDEFLLQIRTNKLDKKLGKLLFSELKV